MSNHTSIATLALIALAGFAEPALAHAHLKSATPGVDDTVTASPAELQLHFTEGIELSFSGATLAGPVKTEVTTGSARLEAGDDTILVVPILGTLNAGTYTVDWHVLSTDGHKSDGTYSFTVKP